jgi:hypothetical protein
LFSSITSETIGSETKFSFKRKRMRAIFFTVLTV